MDEQVYAARSDEHGNVKVDITITQKILDHLREDKMVSYTVVHPVVGQVEINLIKLITEDLA